VTDVVYGRRPVFEALRGRREVGHVWCTARSRESLDWLPERVSVEPSERLGARAGSEEHQGVVAEVAPYPYAGAAEVLGGERPLVVALDEVTDPHNLGAVARVAECAGAGGLVMTRRRSAAVTAAVCRASAGAVEHLWIARVENLAEFLLDAKRPGLWSYAAAAGAATAYDAVDYRDGAVFVLGAEGRGLRPRVRSSCDQEVAIPLGGQIESLNVGTAAAVLLFEARRQRSRG
jgi:23S rRNA (guanosine2251-2'-O)-methyltransferase